MHLFKAQILFFLSFNVIGYVFMFISIMGTPGMLNEEKPGTKLLVKLLGILLPVAWKGIPLLLFAAVVTFYFQFPLGGELISITSLLLGLGVLLGMIGIYITQSRKS